MIIGEPGGHMTHDPMRQADIDRRLANMAKAPRCGAGRAGVAPAGRRRCGAGKGAGCTAGLKARAAHGACVTAISSSGSGPARLWKYVEVCAEGFARLEHIFKRPAGVGDRALAPGSDPGGRASPPPAYVRLPGSTPAPGARLASSGARRGAHAARRSRLRLGASGPTRLPPRSRAGRSPADRPRAD
jgi:hypothetical protein